MLCLMDGQVVTFSYQYWWIRLIRLLGMLVLLLELEFTVVIAWMLNVL